MDGVKQTDNGFLQSQLWNSWLIQYFNSELTGVCFTLPALRINDTRPVHNTNFGNEFEVQTYNPIGTTKRKMA